VLGADDVDDELEKEPTDLDPLSQALQLPELSRGLATASSLLSWGWSKTVEGTSQAVESIKENETVRNAVDTITSSESYKVASSGIEKAKDKVGATYVETIAPALHSAADTVGTTYTTTIAPSLHSAVDTVGKTYTTTIAPSIHDAVNNVRTAVVGTRSSDE